MKMSGLKRKDLAELRAFSLVELLQDFTLFVQRLARGRHSVSYRVRPEIPGRFSALPTRAYAMYAPELKGNSDELKLNIEDSEVGGQGSENNQR